MGRFDVGTILKCHGRQGEVKVKSAMHDAGLLRPPVAVTVAFPDTRREMILAGMRPHGHYLLLTFEGIHDRDAADALRGGQITIERANLPAPDEAGYYLGDLIGYEVLAESGEAIGLVKDTWDLPANDVLQVDRQGQEILIPLIDEVVVAIDHPGKKVIINPLEGLLE
jgi:16S rRNA processing protein RimM